MSEENPSMNTYFVDMNRSLIPSQETGDTNTVNPVPIKVADKPMSITQLRMCATPPLSEPLFNYANVDPKINDWLSNGIKPQSAKEVDQLVFFCVKKNLQDALSWLVLQCEVTSLNLKGPWLGAEAVQTIASWLDHCPRPIALDLTGQEIGDESATVLAHALKTNSTVISLDLTCNAISDIGASALANMLKKNMTLTSLTLASNFIHDKGVAELACVCKTNATVSSFDVSGSNFGRFGASGLTAFVDMLTTNSTLTSLRLARSGIDDTGAALLGNHLKSNSALTSLDVGHNDFGASGARAFADGIMNNRTMTSFLAEGNFVDATGAKTAFWKDEKLSAFAEHQIEIDRRLHMNARAKPLVLPAAEAFLTLSASKESWLPLEVGDLIVKEMLTLGPDQGNGLEGLQSLVIASDIVKQWELDKTS